MNMLLPDLPAPPGTFIGVSATDRMRPGKAAPGAYGDAPAPGCDLAPGSKLRARGMADVATGICHVVQTGPVYPRLETACLDRSVAPGGCTTARHGPDAAPILGLLAVLAGLRIVATDINTASPPHDVGGTTACRAGHAALDPVHPGHNGRQQELTPR